MWVCVKDRETEGERQRDGGERHMQRETENWREMGWCVCVWDSFVQLLLSFCLSYILVTMFAWQVFLSMSHLTSLSNTFSAVPWTLQSSWSQPWSPWSWLLRSTPAPRSLCSSVFLKTQIQISFPRLLTLQCHLGGIFPNVPLHSHKLQLWSRPPVHAVLQSK